MSFYRQLKQKRDQYQRCLSWLFYLALVVLLAATVAWLIVVLGFVGSEVFEF